MSLKYPASQYTDTERTLLESAERLTKLLMLDHDLTNKDWPEIMGVVNALNIQGYGDRCRRLMAEHKRKKNIFRRIFRF